MTNTKLTGVEHNLKIAPEYFAAVVAGVKHAEMRFNDRNYQTGDVLNLCEWDDGAFTGGFVSVDVTHVCELPSVPGYALLSFELQERRKDEGVYCLATLYEIDGVFTKDPTAIANARGRKVQGYVELEVANRFYKGNKD
ncbi:TPA: DUF3850 domain-containing protein [Salmonella enterica]